jgi:hypothetical protein
MKDPFPPINYPPGVSDSTPDAPWNQVDIVGECYECKCSKLVEEMSGEEYQSYDDNEDGSFLCDICYSKLGMFPPR